MRQAIVGLVIGFVLAAACFGGYTWHRADVKRAHDRAVKCATDSPVLARVGVC